jgi:hypothetical protein
MARSLFRGSIPMLCVLAWSATCSLSFFFKSLTRIIQARRKQEKQQAMAEKVKTKPKGSPHSTLAPNNIHHLSTPHR